MKKNSKKNVDLEQYGWGGLLGTGLGLALAPFTGGLSLAAGAAIGGGLGGQVDNIIGQSKQDKLQEEYLSKLNNKPNTNNQSYNYPQSDLSFYKYGGLVPNAEVENNEVLNVPNNQQLPIDFNGGDLSKLANGFYEANGLNHSQGGIDVNIPEGTKIYSDKLKYISGKTYADEANKLSRDKSKYEKILENKKSTKLNKDTSKRMLDKINKRLNELFIDQENNKINTGKIGPSGKRFALGGLTPYGTPTANVDYSLAEMNTNIGGGNNQGFNFPNISGDQIMGGLNTLGQLSPMLYNIYQGSRPYQKLNEKDFQNKREGESLELMKDRRYNIEPELERNRLSTATFNRNLRESGASKGQYLSNLSLGSINKMRSDAEAFSRKQNVENQYKGEEAQMRSRFGDIAASRKLNIQDINDRNESSRRRLLGSGLSNLSNYSQGRNVTNNQLEVLRSMFPNFDQWFSNLNV